jgi:hypothetical protein
MLNWDSVEEVKGLHSSRPEPQKTKRPYSRSSSTREMIQDTIHLARNVHKKIENSFSKPIFVDNSSQYDYKK